MTPKKIFIGYRRDDGGHARAIYQHLRLWFDEAAVFLDHENLDSGEQFKPALIHAIEKSDLFLAVIGQHWFSEKNSKRLQDTNDITRDEIRTALLAGIPVVPLLCGGASVPKPTDLPADIAPMCDGNAHPVHESEYLPSLNRLIDQLRDTYGFEPRYRPPHGVTQAVHLGDQKLSLYFTDPVDALGRLRRTLHEKGEAAVVGQATLQGMGGVGKTQLALKYCHDFKSQYAGVWWFRAESLLQLQQDCQQFCTANTFPILEAELPHQAVVRFLRGQPRWLLVYDNAEAEYGEKKEHLRPFLPDGDHHLIITARSPDIGQEADIIPLDAWTEEEALPFLRKRLPQAAESDLRMLSRILGGLPLALEQASAYLKKTGSSVAAYCAAIDDLERGKGLLDRQSAQENGYPYSVLATLSLAFDKLSDAARELLRLCAWCAAEPIIDDLFRKPAKQLVAAERGEIDLDDTKRESLGKIFPEALRAAVIDELHWGETVAELTGFALAQRVEVDLTPPGAEKPVGGKALLLHRLTQAVVIHRLCEPALNAPALTGLVRLAYPGDLWSTKDWPLTHVLTPHVLRLEDHLATGHVPFPALSWLMNGVAMYLQCGLALYSQAVEIFKRNLVRVKEVLGPDHPNTLSSMNNLASILRNMGDHAGAKELEEHALARMKEILGPDHPQTLSSMNNLASTLNAMGDHAGAKALQKHVLTRRQEVLGQDHPQTLFSMNNLASTLWNMGDHAGAKALQEHALARSKEILGPDHPVTLASMNNLGSPLWKMGDHSGAKALLKHVVARSEEILGPEHPQTLSSMNNLASTLKATGDHAGAKALQEHVLARREEILGPDHPHTTVSAWNLFATLDAMGDRAAAQAIINEHLSWLLADGVELHSDTQRQIREKLSGFIAGSTPTALAE